MVARLLVALAIFGACRTPPGPAATQPADSSRAEATAPVAARRPHAVESPHGTRQDPYYWLRDDTRTDPAVLAYLAAENAYANRVLAPHKALEDTLVAEMRARIQEDDSTPPTFDDGYWYYTRYATGNQYPIHARKKGTLQATEEVLLDANQLARGHAFYAIGDYAVSRDGRMLAWAEDSVGRNQFTLRVKNLATGQVLPDTAANIAPELAWAADGRTLFYTGKDAETLREDRVYRHALGGAHDLVYQEPDASYYVSLSLTKSKRYVVIDAWATTNTEVRLVDATAPASPPTVFLARSPDHIYALDHLGERFVMRTNEGAKNFRLVEVPAGRAADRKAWKELVPHRADVLLESFALYDAFTALNVRSGGLRRVRVLPARGAPFELEGQDPSYAMTLDDTPDARSTRVRYRYDSMTTPSSTFEVDVAAADHPRTLLKQTPVPTYDPSKYASEYLHATTADGVQVPISVVYRKDTARDGTAPLLVTGYGAYGDTSEPELDIHTLSLVDRGWVYAIAHVRGGEELGRAWYEAGRQLSKRNTFTDFIAATEHLVAQRYAARDQLYATGGSAGGLLMGAIANLRPDLYRGIAAFVPFVDVVTTMLDDSIPLTSNELDEWGDPADKAAYDYMLGYSPYDNVTAQAYPSIYVRTGLWDSQVQYYEPAKWVAKLRATKTDRNLLVFDVDMTAGHSGASGRFDQLREWARAFTFFLHVRTSRHTRGDASGRAPQARSMPEAG